MRRPDLSLDRGGLVAALDCAEPVARVHGVPHEVLGGAGAPEEARMAVPSVAVSVGPAHGHGRVGGRDDDVSPLCESRGEQLFLGVEAVGHDVLRLAYPLPHVGVPPVGAVRG